MIVSLSVSFVKTIKTKSGIWLNLFLHLPLPILHQPLRRYLLQSGVHEAWVRRYTSYLGQTMRYIITDVFTTFPFPEEMTTISDIGEKYYLHRQSIMITEQIGLTELYNRMNDPAIVTSEITELRELHKCLDIAVMRAYSWDDLVFLIDSGSNYGFYETKFGTRWMMKPDLTLILVDRLLRINHQRKMIV